MLVIARRPDDLHQGLERETELILVVLTEESQISNDPDSLLFDLNVYAFLVSHQDGG